MVVGDTAVSRGIQTVQLSTFTGRSVFDPRRADWEFIAVFGPGPVLIILEIYPFPLFAVVRFLDAWKL